MSEIDWLVNRLHVGTSNRQVIREFWRRIPAPARHDRTYRHDRHAIYRRALQTHHANQELYGFVMRGS
jgi:hypothetical protein